MHDIQNYGGSVLGKYVLFSVSVHGNYTLNTSVSVLLDLDALDTVLLRQAAATLQFSVTG